MGSPFCFLFPIKISYRYKSKCWLWRLVDCLPATWWVICLILLNSYSSLKTEQKCLLSSEALQVSSRQNQAFPTQPSVILCLNYFWPTISSFAISVVFSSIERDLRFLWPDQRSHFLASPISMCGHVTKIQLMRYTWMCLWRFLGAFLKKTVHVKSLPLCPFFHSAAWNVNVMTGALATILDPKRKGLRKGGIMSWKELESLRTYHSRNTI